MFLLPVKIVQQNEFNLTASLMLSFLLFQIWFVPETFLLLNSILLSIYNKTN